MNKMNESKMLLIGFVIVGMICCCMAGISFWGFRQFEKQVENISNGGDPDAVAKMQEKIVDFDVPPGYQPLAMSMVIYDMVYLTPSDSSEPMIILMQYNTVTATSREQMERSLRQAAEQQGAQPGVAMEVVDSFETVIRGETVTVNVSEGNTSGFSLRQWMTVFEGNNGLVLMMIQGPVEGWNDQLVETFIKSIK